LTNGNWEGELHGSPFFLRASFLGKALHKRGALLEGKRAAGSRRSRPCWSAFSRKISHWESFWNPKVLWLALNYFCVVTASVGMLLFLPNSSKVGWVTMIRDICALR
jgi:hypothetical protein